jgi:hypothetical protein
MSMKSRMRKLKMVYPAQLRDKKQQGEVQIIASYPGMTRTRSTKTQEHQ